jgi:DNA-binding NarL/FixJ family response regulator
MTRRPSTRLIIFSLASLHREAWRALLSSQPDILIVDAVADAGQVGLLLQPDQPTAVLVDVLSPEPDLAQQLGPLRQRPACCF